MKTDIHPNNSRQVIFKDTQTGEAMLLWSTVKTEDQDKWEDGNTYDLYKAEISSASHPFYTGKDTVLDTAGRVDKFKQRMAQAKKA